MVRKGCNGPADVLSPECPTRLVLDLITDKWTALVIYLLFQGTRRYGKLQREVGGISQKMLTQTLRKLEDNGLVKRVLYSEIPSRTEYSLTDLGLTLRKPLSALREWTMTFSPEVEKARKETERRRAKDGTGVDPLA